MVKLFVEGGGDTSSLKTECRQGFATFLAKAGLGGKMPRIVACGSRGDAFDSFAVAVRNGENAVLLIDSEELVKLVNQVGSDCRKWLPWNHLKSRQGDGWEKPDGATDRQCNLMIVCMESWFLADRQTMGTFFGQGFAPNALPPEGRDIETIPKAEVYRALDRATQHTKSKGGYGKGSHSFKLLAQIDPAKVQDKSPWAKRFIEYLSELG